MRYEELIDEKYEMDDTLVDIPLPISQFEGDGALELAMRIQQMIKQGEKPLVVSLHPLKLQATQDYLDPSGFSDPVLFKQFSDKPVIIKINNSYHIVDGHKLVAEANRKKQNIACYLFSAN